MSPESRIKLAAIAGILGMISIIAVIYFSLPDEIEEFLRRQAAGQLDQAASEFTETWLGACQSHEQSLSAVANDSEMKSAFSSAETDGLQMLTLAARLAKKRNLDFLVLLGENGEILSAYPDAEKVGLVDKRLAEMTKQVNDESGFVRTDDKTDDVSPVVFVKRYDKHTRLMSICRKSRSDLEMYALRLGVRLDDFSFEKPKTTTDDDKGLWLRRLRVETKTGEPVGWITLRMDHSGMETMRLSLARVILFFSLPILFVFCIVLITLGWKRVKSE